MKPFASFLRFFRALVGTSLGLTLALSAFAESAKAPTHPNFANRWISTAWLDSPTLEGTVRSRAYIRFVSTSEGAFPVANITYLKVPKFLGDGKADLTSIAETLRKGMGFRSWHRRRQGAAQVFEAPWTTMRRFVRLYVKDEKDGVAISIAIFRNAYGELVAKESELIQRGLMGALDPNTPWIQPLFTGLQSALGIQEAWAEPCPPCNPTNFMICAGCNNTALGTDLTSVNSNLGGINNNLGTATANGTNAANTANGTAGRATDNGTAVSNRAVDSGNRIGDDANRNWANTNHELSRANDTLEKLTSPSNAFVLGAATAAGAVLGAAAVSLAIDGVSAAVGAIVEAVTHEKEDAARLQAFMKAREKIEKLDTETAKLEAAIDNSAYLAALSRKFGSREKLLAVVSADSRRIGKNLERLTAAQKVAEDAGLAGPCVEAVNLEVAKVERLKGNIDSFLTVVRAQDFNTLCKKMRDDVDMLRRAEDELQKARVKIYSGYSAYVRDEATQRAQTVKDLQDGQKRIDENQEAELKLAATTREGAYQQMRAAYAKAFAACLDRESPFWSNVPILGRAVTGGSREKCRKEAMQADDGGQTIAQRKEAAEELYRTTVARVRTRYAAQRAQAPQMAVDQRIAEGAHRAVQNWVDELSAKQTAEHLRGREDLLQMREADIQAACHDRW